MTEYTWQKTSHKVYMAIYTQHKDQLRCCESYTDVDDYNHILRAQITAWGFADADHPIIRSELHNYSQWTYYILKAVTHDD